MTTDQLTFDLAPLVAIEVDSEATIQERFDEFHRLNPWVLEAFVALTRDWLSRGHRRAGIKMFAEVIRWEYDRATVGDSFRLNNNLVSRYVRLLVDEHPEFAEVFATRELRAA